MGVGVKIIRTPLVDVVIVETTPNCDHRGTLIRLFCEQELGEIVKGRHIAQINYTRTEVVGAIRGLHYQRPPNAEMKLVRCIKGRVWDVAIDLRKNSPGFLRWFSVELTPMNARMLVIPEGCAHGFQVLEAGSELLYLHTAPYSKADEGGVNFDDPRINIQWPLPVTDLSVRDKSHPFLGDAFVGLSV